MKSVKVFIGIEGAGYYIKFDKELLPVPPELAQVKLIELLRMDIDDLSRKLREKVTAIGVLDDPETPPEASGGQESGENDPGDVS